MAEDDFNLFDAFDRRRDDASFRLLYRRHSPMLFALAVRMCGSSAEAEELLQDTWVRAVERHAHFDRRSKYSTWLTGILINCVQEARRRHRRTPDQLADDDRYASGTVIQAFPAGRPAVADPIDVERAMARLSDGFREVVILHDLHGYTHQEIGAMLGIQDGTSKSQLARGRARLRELLTEPSPSRAARRERGAS